MKNIKAKGIPVPDRIYLREKPNFFQMHYFGFIASLRALPTLKCRTLFSEPQHIAVFGLQASGFSVLGGISDPYLDLFAFDRASYILSKRFQQQSSAFL
jgi:hypothetical protein